MRRSRLAARVGECGPLIQVALDFTDLWSALRVASLMPDSSSIVLEAGTPLLKSWGMMSVKALRALRPEALIVADTKTVDAVSLEAKASSEAGADAFTVLALAEDESLKAAVEEAEVLGISVYGDTIASKDPLGSLERLQRFGLHIALVHVGVDVQARLGLRAADLMNVVKSFREAFKGIVAVAGGIKPGEVELFVKAGADIVIIGSAITKSQDPRGEALKAIEALRRAGSKCP